MTARLILDVNSACARPANATLILHSRGAVNAKATADEKQTLQVGEEMSVLLVAEILSRRSPCDNVDRGVSGKWRSRCVAGLDVGQITK